MHDKVIIGDYINKRKVTDADFSSELKLRAKSIDMEKLWDSKNRSSEFMGDIWSLFVGPEKEERIKTILHSICVELIENAVKFSSSDNDYFITANLNLKSDELLVYVINHCNISQIQNLEQAANQVLDSENIRKLFKQKMKEAKIARKKGEHTSQLGFIRILMMQDVKLAWQIKRESNIAIITTLARISL